MTQIGFIGLGNMGAPMARNLAKGGFTVVAFDVNAEVLAALAAEDNIAAAADARAVGESCEAAITMLPDSDAVEAVVNGGLADGLGRGGTIIDMSSSQPARTVALGEALAAREIALIDAPVSGGVARAHDGTLTIMAGGDPAAIDRAAPVLQTMGTIHRTGKPGSGHAVKALNNFLSAIGVYAVSEALIVGREFGLDPHVMNAIFNTSTGRNNATERKVEQNMLSGTFDSGFALSLMAKDVGMARDLATELGLDAPTLQFCADLLDRTLDARGNAADHTEAFAYMERQMTKRTP